MRVAVVLLVFLFTSPIARADSSRATSIVKRLRIDQRTADRLLDVLSLYDQEIDRLHEQRSDLRRSLVATKQSDAKTIEKLLDDGLANQRALLKADERLLARLRSFLSPRVTAAVLLQLSITETGERVARHDPDALWPPGRTGPCDPFRSMHNCAPPCDPWSSMHGCRR